MEIYCLVLLIFFVGVKAESDWYIVVGGWNDESASLSTVELFNSKTGDQCIMAPRLPRDISAHVGGLMSDGTPIVCGGLSDFVPQSKCYYFVKGRGAWFEHSDLIEDTYFGGMVFVPITKQLYVFGGNSLSYSQHLSDSGSWTQGPDLYNSENVIGQCVVQLDSHTTAFLGGSNNAFRIVTLDWTTMEYTFAAELQRPRANSACTTAVNEYGDTVVAIAGGGGFGGSQGLEIWNPKDGTVTLEVDRLPQEEVNDSSLQNAFLVSINGGQELLISGGYDGSKTQSSIWKYSLVDKVWSEHGQLINPRNDHVVLPIDDISCL